jgi:hypothetical protein
MQHLILSKDTTDILSTDILSTDILSTEILSTEILSTDILSTEILYLGILSQLFHLQAVAGIKPLNFGSLVDCSTNGA